MAQGGRRDGWAEDGLALGIESCEELNVLELRKVAGNGFIERDLALFHQLESRDGGNGLGHGRDTEDAVELEGRAVGFTMTECTHI